MAPSHHIDDRLPYLRQKGITQFAEGVVFYSQEGRMAKLRRDMFDWFKGRSHKE